MVLEHVFKNSKGLLPVSARTHETTITYEDILLILLV